MENNLSVGFLFKENRKKLWRIVRLTLVILCGFLMTVSAETYSQVTKLSMNFEEKSIREIMDYIENNSEFIFLYKEMDLNVSKRISVHLKNARINDILNEMLGDEDVSYTVYEKQIVIFNEPGKIEPLAVKGKIQQPEKKEIGTGSIQGHIKDEDGNPLVGASIVVDKTTTGTITDVNGNFLLLAVQAGRQNIKFSFVGYQEKVREVLIMKGEVIDLNVQLIESKVEIQGVIAYGQARGQVSAIQQQIKAKGISNVVSAEKLQELPDVNVAEAVGRLPGLMVQRDRGEGQKIIIRGLSPKYNSISIDGNMVPATSEDDRSTDMNLISPDILGGVEVQKAITADQDAAGLGGTVNMTLRQAPVGFKMNGTIEAGYHSQTQSVGTYKGNFYVSNRFLNNKIGIMLTGNMESAERNSDRFSVGYDVQGEPNYSDGQTFVKPWITSAAIMANVENRTRAGGSVLLDWNASKKTTIKSSNFVGYLSRNTQDRSKSYGLDGNTIGYNQNYVTLHQLMLSNAIEGKHLLLGSVFNWGISRSQSINEQPYNHNLSFRQPGAIVSHTQGSSFDVEPPELIPSPANTIENVNQLYLNAGKFSTYQADETEYSTFGNLEIPFKIGQLVSGSLKTGVKFRQKDRIRDNNETGNRFDFNENVVQFLRQYPNTQLTKEGVVGRISVLNFLDANYKPREMFRGKYPYLKLDYALDRKIIEDLYNNYLRDIWYENGDNINYAYKVGSDKNNYKTYESILAIYLMSEINIGKFITFIPGVRYERSFIEYHAKSSVQQDSPDVIYGTFRDTTATNDYYNILPQIHLRIKPTDWFDIRLAYTTTLSRPDYGQLAPKMVIDPDNLSVTLGNTKLDPVISRNYDLILTFYKPKIGLLTLGAFQKSIAGFLWQRQSRVLAGTMTDPSLLGLPRSTLGYSVTYPLNNSRRSYIKGFESDIQTTLNFLPVKGFVFNLNFTLMDSEGTYLETLYFREANPDYGTVPGAARIRLNQRDTAYVDRLLQQATYLANVGLGYDNKKIGLSVRLSFNYQDDILSRAQKRPDGADREGTLEFHRWDMQINQRITKKLSFNANVANIFNQPDRSVRLITGYLTNLEYYGVIARVGLRYEL